MKQFIGSLTVLSLFLWSGSLGFAQVTDEDELTAQPEEEASTDGELAADGEENEMQMTSTGELTSTSTATSTATTTATSTATSTANPVTIFVMKHVCPSIKSQSEFNALGDFVTKAVACPTVVRTGDSPAPNARTLGNADFNFLVQGRNAQNQVVNFSSPSYAQHRICETEVNRDLNDDGNVSTSTCLDASGYHYAGIPRGAVTITESNQVNNTSFGAVEFTPPEITPNDDRDALVSISGNRINLDTARSTSSLITLHVFDFALATSTGTSTTGTSTSGQSNLELRLIEQLDRLDALLSRLSEMLDQMDSSMSNMSHSHDSNWSASDEGESDPDQMSEENNKSDESQGDEEMDRTENNDGNDMEEEASYGDNGDSSYETENDEADSWSEQDQADWGSRKANDEVKRHAKVGSTSNQTSSDDPSSDNSQEE